MLSTSGPQVGLQIWVSREEQGRSLQICHRFCSQNAVHKESQTQGNSEVLEQPLHSCFEILYSIVALEL